MGENEKEGEKGTKKGNHKRGITRMGNELKIKSPHGRSVFIGEMLYKHNMYPCKGAKSD